MPVVMCCVRCVLYVLLWCVLRITCVVLLCSAAKALAEFDSVMVSLSKWCSQYGASATSLPKVGEVIAVKGEEPGSWMRAKVSRQASERFVVRV